MKSLTNLFLTLLCFIAFTATASVTTSHPTVDRNWNKHKHLIVESAVKTHTSPRLLTYVAYKETSFQSIRGSSGTQGMFQFQPATWRNLVKLYGKKHGIKPGTSPYNARANAIMAGEYAKHNRDIFVRIAHREPTDEELYMSHFLGEGGGPKMAMANGNRLARDVLPAAARANKKHFYKKGKPITVAQFRANIRADFKRVDKLYGSEAQVIALFKHNVDGFQAARR